MHYGFQSESIIPRSLLALFSLPPPTPRQKNIYRCVKWGPSLHKLMWMNAKGLTRLLLYFTMTSSSFLVLWGLRVALWRVYPVESVFFFFPVKYWKYSEFSPVVFRIYTSFNVFRGKLSRLRILESLSADCTKSAISGGFFCPGWNLQAIIAGKYYKSFILLSENNYRVLSRFPFARSSFVRGKDV